MKRVELAFSILTKYKQQEYFYLGEGGEAVVFHDNEFVYKVFLSKEINRNIYFNKDKLFVFNNSTYFMDMIDVFLIDTISVIKYEYFKEHEKLSNITESEIIGFIYECWCKKIILKDIKKENFAKIKNKLIFIDYTIPDNWDDNLFFNMITRSFIMLKYFDKPKDFIVKLNRTAINNFNLPQLECLQEFVNKIFEKILIFDEKIIEFNTDKLISYLIFKNFDELLNYIILQIHFKTFEVKLEFDINFKKLYYALISKNIFLKEFLFIENENNTDFNFYKIVVEELVNPVKTVSLVIKTCPQDTEVIYEQILHIIKQISSPNIFIEKIIAIDKKEKDFLREYQNKYTLNDLLIQIKPLLENGFIDKIIELPYEEIIQINKKWFNLETNETHSIKNIPITPQLFAFEKAKGEYILQMDSDVLIGRTDYFHSFLNDMIYEIESNNNVVSVGFNIPHKNTDFIPYFGFENGGFVPEVRLGLFNKQKLMNMLPLPNNLIENKLELSWYRSLHKKQKETGFTSIRGGSPKSYYIHPQNYRKSDKDAWFTILDRIEQNILPDLQFEHFDVEGSYYDWTISKRNEEIVIISYLKDLTYAKFIRLYKSIISQNSEKWGWIIINDNSINGLDYFISYTLNKYKERITIINNKFYLGYCQSIYKAIHYFTQNEETIIVLLNSEDLFIREDVLTCLFNQYAINNYDVLLGEVYLKNSFNSYNLEFPNLVEPRQINSNLEKKFKTFKKYLFDSINLYDFKIYEKDYNIIPKKNKNNNWIEFSSFCFIIPIIEMSKNPGILKNIQLYSEKIDDIKELKDFDIKSILSKESKTSKDLFKGRNFFYPNLNKIEIDITFECNLNCIGCNRSCSQAPSNEKMDINQINKFITESIGLNKKWDLINILGGEPTLHPEFEHIIKLIMETYIYKFSPTTILQITSNGLTQTTKKILEKINNEYKNNLFIDYASFKTTNEIIYFSQFNDAPIDNPSNLYEDYSKACWVTSYCGIGLNKNGYYCCSVAGGIDRVLKQNNSILSLKNIENLEKQFNLFCQYCGNFTAYSENKGDIIDRAQKRNFNKQIISKTWKIFYEGYINEKK